MSSTTRTPVARTIVLGAVLALAATACSTKAPDAAAPTAAGGVKTDVGVTGDTIRLGVLTDQSGAFAALGREITQSQQLFWKQVNSGGGVCGKYQVALDVQDHRYSVQDTVSLYSGMKRDVVAMQQVLGAAQSLALRDQIAADDVLVVAHTSGPALLKDKHLLMAGAAFDVEAINGLQYFQDKGIIKDGAKIGHIYFQGDYGQGALAGVRAFAASHSDQVVGAQITPTVTDLTAQVVELKRQAVNIVVVSTAPPQLAATASAMAANGLDVPIMGSNPAFAAALLASPAGPFLERNYYTSFPVSAFDGNETAAAFRQSYLAEHPGEDPTLQIMSGYAEAAEMRAVLESACRAGDLTRTGLATARAGLTQLDTKGVTPELDLSQVGHSVTTETLVLRAAQVPGGLKAEAGPLTSKVAEDFEAAR